MKELTRILKDRPEKWAWIGQRAHDAAGISKIVDLELILSCDWGRETSELFTSAEVFSLEKDLKLRKDWSNEHLAESLNASVGRAFLDRISGKEAFNLISYRSLMVLEDKAPGSGARLLASPLELKRKFDNKILFHQALPGLGINTIKGFISRPCEISYDEVRRRLDGDFVLQRAFSSSGVNTFLVKESSQYRTLVERFSGEEVLIRKLIPGYSVNVNAVVYPTPSGAKVALSWPSVQITGAAECSNFASSYCGNDYASACGIPEEVIEKVRRITVKVGEWMAESGYRGLFGMDHMVRGGDVFPVEINPRLQNSTSLLTVLENIERPDEDTLMALHLAQFFTGHDPAGEMLASLAPDEFLKPVKGSQVILHNPLQRSIVGEGFVPGVYRLKGPDLQLLEPGGAMPEDMPEDAFLVSCGVPVEGCLVEPNAPLCKIESRGPAVADDMNSLSRHSRERIRAVYGKLGLREIKGSRIKLKAHAEAGQDKVGVVG